MTRSRILSTVMAAVFLTVGISCTDSLPTGVTVPELAPPSSQPVTVSPSLVGGLLGVLGKAPVVGQLLTCRPQPYAADTLVVGPRGGTLHIGPHRLVIPRGALTHRVRIIGEAPRDKVVSVRFQPEGLKFNKRHPARLTLDYKACGLLPTLLPKHIAYTDESLNILDILLGSVDNLLRREVTAPVRHFSRYALAY